MKTSAFRLTLAASASTFFILLAGQAQAAVPTSKQPVRIDRSTLLAAEGGYQLADGRTLNLRTLSRSVEVRVNEESAERWLPVSEAVLVSPDGRQRLHLHRDANGVVNQVSLESPRQR